MQHVTDPAHLRAALTAGRGVGRTIAFVPTMGNLHAGHLRLVEFAQGLADITVASIFVNPIQFDCEDDLRAYPQTLEQDLRLLASQDVNFVFTPDEKVMYPRGLDTISTVTVPGLSDELEGEFRPGHFTGVATVVCKLLNIVRPDLAILGEKDYQQLLVVQRMVSDLNMGVEIRGVPTVREEDGLAMSSRNRHLSGDERRRAPALHRVLTEVAQAILEGDQDLRALAVRGEQALRETGLNPQYVSIRRSRDLGLPLPGDRDLIILVAAWLGKTRLIDNLRIRR